MPTEFYFQILPFNLGWKKIKIIITETLNSDKSDSNQCYSESESQNQQQPIIVPIQQLFQHSSQLECSPADVGSNERIDQISGPVFSKPTLSLSSSSCSLFLFLFLPFFFSSLFLLLFSFPILLSFFFFSSSFFSWSSSSIPLPLSLLLFLFLSSSSCTLFPRPPFLFLSPSLSFLHLFLFSSSHSSSSYCLQQLRLIISSRPTTDSSVELLTTDPQKMMRESVCLTRHVERSSCSSIEKCGSATENKWMKTTAASMRRPSFLSDTEMMLMSFCYCTVQTGTNNITNIISFISDTWPIYT